MNCSLNLLLVQSAEEGAIIIKVIVLLLHSARSAVVGDIVIKRDVANILRQKSLFAPFATKKSEIKET